jgi:hypothetical protein
VTTPDDLGERMIGSIGSGSVAADLKRGAESTGHAADKTVADHVSAVDEQEPIRSVQSTQGTLVDTYL